MIYNLISSDLIKEVTFISVLFAFILTWRSHCFRQEYPSARCQDVPMPSNGSKSVGKPRGAGIIFILTFTLPACYLSNWMRKFTFI